MTSTSESSTHSPVETAAVVAHGRVDVRGAVEQVHAVAARAGVEIVDEPERAQLAVAVGGDGTILRTLARLLGTGIPVIGINFGRVDIAGLDEVRRRVVREVADAALSWGASVRGVVDSGLPGPKGNREIFLHLVHSQQPTLPDDLDERIEHALAG